jgi:hypothetical protein
MEMNGMLLLVGYPYLLQYIRRYSPYMEVISSICNLETYHAVVTVEKHVDFCRNVIYFHMM